MAVVGFDVTLRRALAEGKSFGDVGPYEELKAASVTRSIRPTPPTAA